MMKIFIIRRNDGLGGAEGAARRITSFLEEKYPGEVHRIKAGMSFEGFDFGSQTGPGWFKTLHFVNRVNRFLSSLKDPFVAISLERGILAHYYRAGDGVHRHHLKIKYTNPLKKWIKPINWISPFLEQRTLQHCRKVIANSNLVQKNLLAYYPWLKGHIQVIHNGVDRQRFCLAEIIQSSDHEKVRNFIFVGHDWSRKGLKETLNICAAFKTKFNTEFNLIVLGKGTPDDYSDQIHRLGLKDQVSFLGEQKDIVQYYQSADVMIFPTHYDPFSNACLEALACGCSVVTTHSNGASEVIQHNQSGYILANPSEITPDLLNFLNKSFSRDEVSQSVQHLDAEHELKGIQQLIETHEAVSDE